MRESALIDFTKVHYGSCGYCNMNLALTLDGEEARLPRGYCNEKAQAWFLGGLSKGCMSSVPRWCHIRSSIQILQIVPQLLMTSLLAHPPPPEDYRLCCGVGVV